ncbi:hypothetical protein H257_15285 [Aphanomyces astaci]|uniref:Uncharacterized protein n=1 Tax=Aphanomyces astaci TaxID=112090 RepID=W4FN99_APHAT|nr:hypothetical protein H257_15285 [Aphanomyces astaci]ETV68945.1 hypothetical protein H257_15285 [Aphanomyces astaci]|eukprot:XP_009841622.1 hypothetical protein H257_15285 [Aphanomyces astaci]
MITLPTLPRVVEPVHSDGFSPPRCNVRVRDSSDKVLGTVHDHVDIVEGVGRQFDERFFRDFRCIMHRALVPRIQVAVPTPLRRLEGGDVVKGRRTLQCNNPAAVRILDAVQALHHGDEGRGADAVADEQDVGGEAGVGGVDLKVDVGRNPEQLEFRAHGLAAQPVGRGHVDANVQRRRGAVVERRDGKTHFGVARAEEDPVAGLEPQRKVKLECEAPRLGRHHINVCDGTRNGILHGVGGVVHDHWQHEVEEQAIRRHVCLLDMSGPRRPADDLKRLDQRHPHRRIVLPFDAKLEVARCKRLHALNNVAGRHDPRHDFDDGRQGFALQREAGTEYRTQRRVGVEQQRVERSVEKLVGGPVLFHVER